MIIEIRSLDSTPFTTTISPYKSFTTDRLSISGNGYSQGDTLYHFDHATIYSNQDMNGIQVQDLNIEYFLTMQGFGTYMLSYDIGNQHNVTYILAGTNIWRVGNKLRKISNLYFANVHRRNTFS